MTAGVLGRRGAPSVAAQPLRPAVGAPDPACVRRGAGTTRARLSICTSRASGERHGAFAAPGGSSGGAQQQQQQLERSRRRQLSRPAVQPCQQLPAALFGPLHQHPACARRGSRPLEYCARLAGLRQGAATPGTSGSSPAWRHAAQRRRTHGQPSKRRCTATLRSSCPDGQPCFTSALGRGQACCVGLCCPGRPCPWPTPAARRHPLTAARGPTS